MMRYIHHSYRCLSHHRFPVDWLWCCLHNMVRSLCLLYNSMNNNYMFRYMFMSCMILYYRCHHRIALLDRLFHFSIDLCRAPFLCFQICPIHYLLVLCTGMLCCLIGQFVSLRMPMSPYRFY